MEQCTVAKPKVAQTQMSFFYVSLYMWHLEYEALTLGKG